LEDHPRGKCLHRIEDSVATGKHLDPIATISSDPAEEVEHWEGEIVVGDHLAEAREDALWLLQDFLANYRWRF